MSEPAAKEVPTVEQIQRSRQRRALPAWARVPDPSPPPTPTPNPEPDPLPVPIPPKPARMRSVRDLPKAG